MKSFQIREGAIRLVFLGEQEKWVPVSRQRIRKIDVDDKSFSAIVYGALKERVSFAFKYNDHLVLVECFFEWTNELELKYYNDVFICN